MRHAKAQVRTHAAASHTIGPVGAITRGTTAPNRLRRQDRWLVHRPEVRRLLLSPTVPPLVVDLGYGASPTTPLELARRLRHVRADVRVLGLEIDPARVQPPREGVEFALGGFELAGHRPHLVRAANVLRQYPEAEVPQLWHMVCSRLAPGGLFVEGTCDEIGRRSWWVTLSATSGPFLLTAAWHPASVPHPSVLAERLPKALIHRNVPGEPIHRFLADADIAWNTAATHAPFGPRQRWRAAHAQLREMGWPLERLPPGLRDNQFTLAWSAIAPTDFHWPGP